MEPSYINTKSVIQLDHWLISMLFKTLCSSSSYNFSFWVGLMFSCLDFLYSEKFWVKHIWVEYYFQVF